MYSPFYCSKTSFGEALTSYNMIDNKKYQPKNNYSTTVFSHTYTFAAMN